MSWNPREWKRPVRFLLGMATVWPVIYMFLFMGSILSMMIILPLAASRAGHDCGSLDLLQLDEKIKRGEVKQLTLREGEITAFDRVGDCQFTVYTNNDDSRQKILADARELSGTRPRVDKIDYDKSRAEAPIFLPIGFAALMIAHMGTILLMMALMPAYIIFAVKNEELDQTMRIVWVILACTVGMLSNIVYWYLYIWRRPRVANPTPVGAAL